MSVLGSIIGGIATPTEAASVGAGNDTLIGNDGNNVLNGGAGNDTMFANTTGDTVAGGDGTDTVKFTPSVAGQKFALAADVESLEILGGLAANGTGNDLDNALIGNSAANSLTGGAGNDTLDGKGGADTMAGGEGDDLYFVDAAADRVQEDGTTDGDEIRSNVTINLANASGVVSVGNDRIEKVMLPGALVANITGNALDNVLTGNAAANVLDGGPGDDTMIGNAGNDTYVVDSTGDVVQETIAGAAGGTDTVQSSISYTLGTNLEKLLLTGTGDINGTGNAANNVLTGNSGANVLDGGAGADTMAGGAGSDILLGGDDDDSFVFDAADAATSGAVDGGAGNDTLLLTGSGVTLSLIAAPDGRYVGIEYIDLTGTGANTLLLNPSDVVALSDTDRLVVNGNIGDVLKSIGQGWTSSGTESAGSVVYATFTHSSGAELWVDTEIGFTVT